MNRSEIRTEVRRILSQKTVAQSYVSDADINSFINDGIRDMCIKGGIYIKTLTLTVSGSIYQFYLPQQFLNAKTFISPLGNPLDEVDIKNLGRAYTGGIDGRPIVFWLLPHAITLSTRVNGATYLPWEALPNPSHSLMVLSSPDGYIYEDIGGGVTDIAPPTFTSPTPGKLFVDGTVTWMCGELISSLKTINLTYPITGAGGGVGIYTLIYSALDNSLPDDATAPHFPGDKHHHLIPYASYRCAEKAKQSALAQTFFGEYASGLGIPVPSLGIPDSPVKPT